MEERKTIFDYLEDVLSTFGIAMVLMMFFCKLFGEHARGLSSMFRMGSAGLSLETMGQYLLVAVIIELAKIIFFTEWIFKKLSFPVRLAGMLGVIIGVISLFIIIFDWFPVQMWEPWAMFFVCFALSFSISMAVVTLREKMENRKMEEALSRLKKEWEKEDDK